MDMPPPPQFWDAMHAHGLIEGNVSSARYAARGTTAALADELRASTST
jgi:hypothetical protein